MEENKSRRGTFDAVSDAASRIIFFVSRPFVPNVIAGLGPIVLSVLGVILFLALVIVITGGGVGTIGDIGTGTTPAPASTAPIASELTQCLFYDRGRSIRIGNPQVSTFIQNISKKVGVPAPIIMAILRREHAFFSDTRPETFQSDYDATLGGLDPILNQRATGVMQVMPSTFSGVFRTFREELGTKFGKVEKSLDTSPHTFQEEGSVFRIASIRDSIIAGTYELRRLKNAAYRELPWDDPEVVRGVAARYHGGEGNPNCSLNYCDDVLTSVVECRPSTFASVIQLYESLNTNPECRSGITRANFPTCVAPVPPTLHRVNEIIGEIQTSVINHTYLQCVGFVQAVIPLVDYPRLGNPPNPRAIVQNPPTDYIFIEKGSGAIISPGDIPIWYSSERGHIGFVVNVSPNGNFQVIDANWCTQEDCGKVQFRQDGLSTQTLVGWLRKR